MLVTTERMLQLAKEGNYAVGAFNVENMEMVMAVIHAASKSRSPVIVQTTPSTAAYAGFSYFYANVTAALMETDIPAAIHLDHGSSLELAVQALRNGYTSVMIDGSNLSFEENIRLTKSVVTVCHSVGICVEGELGRVGGKEEGSVKEDYGSLKDANADYTSVYKAQVFAEQTGINSLAVAIGTSHGVYHGAPDLNFTRLSEISQTVTIPLVLHGASGLSEEDIKECIRCGISKVNFATDLRIAYSNGVKEYIENNGSPMDPKDYGRLGMEYVMNCVRDKMKICGSIGKAGGGLVS